MAYQNVNLGVRPGSKRPSKKTPLPSGSGFDRLVKRRADGNNLPGAVNAFGDRVTGPAQRNRQAAKTGFGGQAFYGGNPRAGKTFQSGLTKTGDTVHIYGSGERVVIPKKRAKFTRGLRP
jgi:hypothetical protein